MFSREGGERIRGFASICSAEGGEGGGGKAWPKYLGEG